MEILNYISFLYSRKSYKPKFSYGKHEWTKLMLHMNK